MIFLAHPDNRGYTDRNRKLRHYARQLRLSQRVGQYFLSKMGTVRQEIKVTELCHGD